MIKPSDIIYWLYLMKENPDGTYFAMFQFDQRCEIDIKEIKSLMITVKLHTEQEGKTVMIRFCKKLINLNGTFDNEFGKELYELFLERMKNKPKSYGFGLGRD